MIKTVHLEVKTPSKEALIDITHMIKSALKQTALSQGSITVFVPHTTAGITINENTDPDVQSDMLMAFKKIVPNYADFKHFEGNSDGHTKASLMGFNQTVLFENKSLCLGTWQALYLCEFDGPKKRSIIVQIQGE